MTAQRMKRLLVVLALLATPADAQTTRCKWVFGVWTCEQDQAPQQRGVDGRVLLDAYRAGQQQRREDEDRRNAQMRDQTARQWSNEEANLRGKIGLMLEQGDCDGATKLALSSGQIGIAAEVKAFCAK